MGHQLTFHLTPVDTLTLEAKLRALGPMVVLHSDSATASPRVVDSLEFSEGGRPWLQLYLARAGDVDSIKMKHVPVRSLWYVDVLDSPVVEFSRCFFNGKVLREGRIYWVDGFYGKDDAWALKNEGFRAWAKRVRSTSKKFLKPHGASLVGPDTASWLASSGGRLIDGFETVS